LEDVDGKELVFGKYAPEEIINWIKRHFFVRTTDDPNSQIEGGFGTNF
jgi:hypothetical protein